MATGNSPFGMKRWLLLESIWCGFFPE
jgi:hypothetical protein